MKLEESRNKFLFPLLALVMVVLVFLSPTPATPQSSDRTYQVKPKVAEQINKAWESYRQGQTQKALNYLKPFLNQSDLPPDVYVLAGRGYFKQNDFSRASQQLRKGLKRLGNHESRSDVKEYLNRSERLRDLDLRERTFAHFTILRTPEVSVSSVSNLNHDLERARRQIGRDLDLMPERRFTVILYRRPQYRRVVQAPIWSGGVFDGKIHIPLREDDNPPYQQRTLYHEYSHALIHEFARNNIPLWFNEGFATYQEYRQSDGYYRYQRLPANPPAQHLLKFQDLSSMFKDTENREKTRLAYEYSYSIMEFLEERFGVSSFKRILQETRRTSTFKDAVENELNRSIESLQYSWETWVDREVR